MRTPRSRRWPMNRGLKPHLMHLVPRFHLALYAVMAISTSSTCMILVLPNSFLANFTTWLPCLTWTCRLMNWQVPYQAWNGIKISLIWTSSISPTTDSLAQSHLRSWISLHRSTSKTMLCPMLSPTFRVLICVSPETIICKLALRHNWTFWNLVSFLPTFNQSATAFLTGKQLHPVVTWMWAPAFQRTVKRCWIWKISSISQSGSILRWTTFVVMLVLFAPPTTALLSSIWTLCLVPCLLNCLSVGWKSSHWRTRLVSWVACLTTGPQRWNRWFLVVWRVFRVPSVLAQLGLRWVLWSISR